MILVTGGTGYLGRALVAKLIAQGASVRVLSRHPWAGAGEAVTGDVTNPAQIDAAMQGVRLIYHLAALVDHHALPEQLYQVNVQGTVNVVESALRHGAERIVHCSSVSAETGGGSTVYGRSKIEAERQLEVYKARIPIVTLRPGPVYDEERSNLQRVVRFARISHLCPRLLPDVTLHLASRGNVTDAFLHAQKAGVPGRAYAICDQFPVQRSALSHIIRQATAALDLPMPIALLTPPLYATALGCEGLNMLFGIRPMIDRHYLKVLIRERRYDISAARAELGYVPATTEQHFATAVARILAAQRSRR